MKRLWCWLHGHDEIPTSYWVAGELGGVMAWFCRRCRRHVGHDIYARSVRWHQRRRGGLA